MNPVLVEWLWLATYVGGTLALCALLLWLME